MLCPIRTMNRRKLPALHEAVLPIDPDLPSRLARANFPFGSYAHLNRCGRLAGRYLVYRSGIEGDSPTRESSHGYLAPAIPFRSSGGMLITHFCLLLEAARRHDYPDLTFGNLSAARHMPYDKVVDSDYFAWDGNTKVFAIQTVQPPSTTSEQLSIMLKPTQALISAALPDAELVIENLPEYPYH